jgi:hypothetical protein
MPMTVEELEEHVKEKRPCAYLTGATLRELADENGWHPLFDSDGTPVLCDEFYAVTSTSIIRVE